MRPGHAILLVTLMLLAGTAAGAEDGSFIDDLESLSVGDRSTVNATLINRLSVQDTLEIKFSGGAIDNGLITVENVTSAPYVSCTNNNLECMVDVPAESSRDVEITVEASAVGQDELKGSVNSTLTELGNADTISIRVGPQFGDARFSAPGLTISHVAVLAVLATLFVVLRRDRN